MAKKKQELTSEELLAEALVREEDWPYVVPGNWVWVRLGSVAEIVTGGTPSKKNPSFYGGDFPFIKPTNLDQGRHVLFAEEYLTEEGKKISRIIPAGSTSVCCIGSIGKCGYLDVEATTNQQINSVLPKINKLYCYYYCCTNFFKNQLNELSSATTISIVNKSKMLSTIIPLPPLAEQQRIVDRVESLFDKLDQAKDLIQEALDSFETRKAAILHQAFIGELTKKWREVNGVGMKSWEEKALKKICKKITDGTHHSPQNSEAGEYLYITAKNIKEYGIELANVTYISKQDHEAIYSRCNVEQGDVLYIKDGATTGIATINNLSVEFSLLSSVALLKPELTLLDPKYLVWNLNSAHTKSKMINNMSGNAITRLTITKIKEATIYMPTLSEQQEIVRILDDLFEKEQNAKDLCDLIDQIEAMKKAILGKAFRGELGTNEAGEESAKSLLKSILNRI